MLACSQCTELDPARSSWVGGILVGAAIASCPCHLPVTLALLGAAGSGASAAAASSWVYAAFGLAFVALVVAALYWTLRSRDREIAYQEHREIRHETVL